MDLTLSSSAVLGVAVLVWLLWVAPHVLQRQRTARAGGDAIVLMDAGGTSRGPIGGTAAASAGPREDAPTRAAVQPGPRPRPGERPLRVRWGRLGVALAGLLCLFAAAVTLVLVLFGLPAWVPALCAAAAVGSVALLRALALQDRRARRVGASHNGIRPTVAGPVADSAPRASSEVFDAGREPEPAPRPLSREELRAAALEVAKASQAVADEAAKASGEVEPGWDPVDVPRPSYLDAPKAERPEPSPLEAPAGPKPEGRLTLKAQAGAPGSAPEVPAQAPPQPAQAPPQASRTGALGNLDEVLQRRRA